MNAILNQTLTLVLAYGYPIIGISVFIGAIGIPFPSIIVVLAAGALAAIGDLNIVILFFVVMCCSMVGDLFDYWLGEKVGHRLLRRFSSPTSHTKIVKNVQKYFFRWSGATIFFTRWLFSLFACVTSVLAGITKYPLRKFIFFDALGQAVAASIFLGIGYLFSAEWQSIWTYIQNISLLLAGLLVGFFLIGWGIKNYIDFERNKPSS